MLKKMCWKRQTLENPNHKGVVLGRPYRYDYSYKYSWNKFISSVTDTHISVYVRRVQPNNIERVQLWFPPFSKNFHFNTKHYPIIKCQLYIRVHNLCKCCRRFRYAYTQCNLKCNSRIHVNKMWLNSWRMQRIHEMSLFESWWKTYSGNACLYTDQ